MKRIDLAGLMDAMRLRWRNDSLEVFQDNDERYMLDAADGFTLDLKQKVARRNGRVLATFDQIENIVVRVYDHHDTPGYWKLILARSGKFDIVIGRTDDQLNCSTVAARMATLAGKNVVVRKGWPV